MHSLNKDHVFSKWLINNAPVLNNKFKGIFRDILSQFINVMFIQQGRKGIYKNLKNLLFLLQKLDKNIIDDEIIDSIEYTEFIINKQLSLN